MLQSCQFCEHSEAVDYGVTCTIADSPLCLCAVAYVTLPLATGWIPLRPEGCKRLREQARTCARWEPMGMRRGEGRA